MKNGLPLFQALFCLTKKKKTTTTTTTIRFIPWICYKGISVP